MEGRVFNVSQKERKKERWMDGWIDLDDYFI